MQKSRVDWLRMGDNNTKFFHTTTLVRRRRNRVDSLMNEEGVWVSDGLELKNLALDFYKKLFLADSSASGVFIKGGFPRVEACSLDVLNKEVTMEETQRALRNMASYKAPGPDGFQAIFFKKTWDVTGEAVHSFVKKAIEEGEISDEAAEASLVLIPKENKPCNIRGFRPISLCTVACKLISKILVNRLKGLMQELVSPCQASFVPGRQGLDNAVICQEYIHSLWFTKAKKGDVIIKIDLEKAYDIMEWAFVEETLVDAGVPSKIVYAIMQLLAKGSCRLIWNGEATDSFKPSRGLRQGDSMSPYLFVLCMERLGHWMRSKVDEGKLRPVRASRSGPGLSYLLFADDLILFSEAVEDQLLCIREGLEKFCSASDQKVNFGKSAMFCSANVDADEARRLSALVGIPLTENLGKYLGHRMLHRGRNKDGLKELVEKVYRRLEGWKLKCLSRAGRLTLAKSVLASLPIFQMQLEKLPAWVHKNLDKAVRSCIWGGYDGKRGVHLLSWEVLTKAKVDGGANIRRAKEMNWALLAKLAWRTLKCTDQTWRQVIAAKYKVNYADGAHFRGKHCASQVWKGIVWGGCAIEKGTGLGNP